MRNPTTGISNATLSAADLSYQDPEQQPDLTVDDDTRSEVIEGVLKNLKEYYVFPEVAAKIEKSIRERVQGKEYDRMTSSIELARVLTAHLQEISHDKHLAVNYSYESLPLASQDQKPDPKERERFHSLLKSRNFWFEKVERLGGNIGYLELKGFSPPEFGGETAVAAMNFLANTDALIIDLRQNGGGNANMVVLISSYLFDSEPMQLSSIYWRPTNETQQRWTLTYVPGKRYGKQKDVYVLISKQTFSAAEEFAYNLQNLKRATIIGETSGGGAHPGESRRINEHFSVGVPSGRAVNPISGTNWEGVGVKPDIEVPADQALKTACLAALKEALEKSTDDKLTSEIKSSIERVGKS
jgi:C-terminal processing protease CtpA/Prc